MMLAPIDSSAILKLRQQILARSDAIGGTGSPTGPRIGGAGETAAPPFGTALNDALRAVSATQDQAGAATTAYETGQTHDLASVMIARQKAAIAFEATLQARNRLIGAYKDVMNMPL